MALSFLLAVHLGLVAIPPAHIVGRVAEVPSGRPLAGVHVRLGLELHDTDADGKFRVPVPAAAGAQNLWLFHPSYVPARLRLGLARRGPLTDLGTIALAPLPDGAAPDDSTRLTGLAVIVDGVRPIAEVIDLSPAAAAGIASGERIVAIDGRNVGDLGGSAIGALLMGRPGQPVQVTVSPPGGPARTVTLLRDREWVIRRYKEKYGTTEDNPKIQLERRRQKPERP